MTEQFTPEIEVEVCRRAMAESRGGEVYLPHDVNNYPSLKALARTLTEYGWQPPVDPVKAKAREIVAAFLRSDGSPHEVTDAVADGKGHLHLVEMVELGIRAGMELK